MISYPVGPQALGAGIAAVTACRRAPVAVRADADVANAISARG
jgi:hypothetical protein